MPHLWKPPYENDKDWMIFCSRATVANFLERPTLRRLGKLNENGGRLEAVKIGSANRENYDAISHRIHMYAIYGSTFTINIPQFC